MRDLISRQAAIDGKICIQRSNGVEIYDDYAVPVKYLEQLPPAQPAPTKRGKWEMGIDERFVKCSECGLMTTRNELRGLAVFGKNEPNFCPNCGADMREVTE